MFCSKCGTETPDDSQFCRKCGQSLTGGPSTGSTRRTSANENPYAFPLVLAVGGVIVLLVAVWLVNDLKPKRTAPPGNAASATEPSTSATPGVPLLLSPQDIYKNESAGMILIETYDDEGRKRTQGSGFIVASDGTSITNYHVIRGASRATVKFADGTVGSVEGAEAYDQNRDVAVIQVTPAPRTVLEIGDSDKLQVGDSVVAIGSPLGLQNTVSVGIVSALRNGVIQMSDPISPGSSGGAVFDAHGKVVAVAVAQMVSGTES